MEDKRKNFEKEKRERRKELQLSDEKLEKVVETVERAGVSANMASQIINEVKVATGTITESNQNQVVYKKKFERLAKKIRKKKIEQKKGIKIKGLMFDERKDLCRKVGHLGQSEYERIENCSIVVFTDDMKDIDVESSKRQKLDVDEENEGLQNEMPGLSDEVDCDCLEDEVGVEEFDGEGSNKPHEFKEMEDKEDEFIGNFEEIPNDKTGEDSGVYIGHCQPLEGTGKSVADSVVQHLEKYEVDTSDLRAVFTDGTSKMTGCHKGRVH